MPAFEAQVRAIAASYLAGRVDDELRWAPWLCRMPYPGTAHQSASNDSTTHGQKLYSVFAKNHGAYPAGPHTDQAVVKESFRAETVGPLDAGYGPGTRDDAGQFPAQRGDGGDHLYPYALKDGVVYRAAEPMGLYIMFKLDPATPDTDDGVGVRDRDARRGRHVGGAGGQLHGLPRDQRDERASLRRPQGSRRRLVMIG